MQRLPISELGRVVSGATPKTNVAAFWDGNIPWVTPADLSEGDEVFFTKSCRKITEAGYNECSTELLPAGAVLFSSRAPIGHIAVAKFPVCTNQGFKSIVCGDRLDPIFAYFALRFVTPEIIAKGRGATFSEINTEIMESVEIPYVDFRRQKLVASQLLAAHRLTHVRRFALNMSEGLLRAVFLEMFGDPLKNPKKWPREELASLCERFSDGPFGSNLKSEHYVPKGVRVIRLQNIGVGEYLDEDKAFVSPKHFESIRKHECLPGDVLVGTLGDPNLRACIQPSDIKQAVNKADCVQARVNDARANSAWFCGLLNCSSTLHLIPGLAHGQTRSRVSMGELAELPVPVPPLSAQLEFFHYARIRDRVVASEREALRQAEHLFQTLLYEAFGERRGA